MKPAQRTNESALIRIPAIFHRGTYRSKDKMMPRDDETSCLILEQRGFFFFLSTSPVHNMQSKVFGETKIDLLYGINGLSEKEIKQIE